MFLRCASFLVPMVLQHMIHRGAAQLCARDSQEVRRSAAGLSEDGPSPGVASRLQVGSVITLKYIARVECIELGKGSRGSLDACLRTGAAASPNSAYLNIDPNNESRAAGEVLSPMTAARRTSI